ncbi:5'-methylthioadenosine/adenosylhomocysteine nucleosidase [Enterococcus sp. 5H]|uniref:5'-methylthioadenosine/adenosylhomocysteine nucleosidase n=1 Tax=Enterococcus sp. 5H TaxID=1229490 RepID=UPI0023033119|nr:5'-methylthioadenosine/adenosylhomocysteine nucleosidase [Enterococcus sp. 5H]MDA9472938.1 5'-methylthioadenosine nucleosidase [Enterococcus sp. 5H]
MKIVIAAAMKEELLPFRELYQTELVIQRGKTVVEKVIGSAKHTLILVETGIGKVNAAASASLVCEIFHPDIIINTGSAGGFSEEITIGDVVYGTELIYSDVDATGFDYAYGQVPKMPKSYLLDQKWSKLIGQLKQPETYKLHKGQIVTADSFMSEKSVVKTIKKRFKHALASDMESTAIAQVSQFYQIPVLNIRGVSDIAGKEAAVSFDAHLNQAAIHAFEQIQKVINLL